MYKTLFVTSPFLFLHLTLTPVQSNWKKKRTNGKEGKYAKVIGSDIFIFVLVSGIIQYYFGYQLNMYKHSFNHCEYMLQWIAFQIPKKVQNKYMLELLSIDINWLNLIKCKSSLPANLKAFSTNNKRKLVDHCWILFRYQGNTICG